MKPKHKHSAAPKDEEKAENGSVAITNIAKPVHKPSDIKRSNADNHGNEDNSFRVRLKLAIEIGTFVGACFIVWFTYQTLQEIRLQSPAIIEATNTANRNLEYTERAYLRVCGASERLQWTHGASLNISVENYGHTTSRNISVLMNYIRSDIKHSPPIGLFQSTSRKKMESTSICPTCTLTIIAELPMLNDADIVAVKAGLQIVAVIGQIYYETGFNKQDTARFAFSYEPRSNSWSSVITGETIDLRTNNPR